MKSRRLFLSGSLVAALAVSLAVATPASAALGDLPLITYNMQGQTTGNDSKWTTTIANYAARAEIVMLQEAGANPPASAPGTQPQLLAGNDLANGGGNLPPGLGGTVIHSQWRNGYATQDVYFLHTDPNGGAFDGGRVNLAIVTQRAAEAVAALPNPNGRATLGVLFNGVWYFNLHAQSRGGTDAPALLNTISTFVNGRQLGESWTALGDFNRAPVGLQNQLPGGAQIYSSGQSTQQSGAELDYAVNSSAVAGVNVARLSGASSDHFAVGIGAMRAQAEPTPLFATPRAVESMQAGGVLDAHEQGTANFTPIDSYVRNGQTNQSWDVEAFDDGTVRFKGTASGRCIDITHSDQNPGSGTSLSLFDCADQASQRWQLEYLGNDEYELRSVLLPDLCMNVAGGQSDPNDDAGLILYACQNTPNERFTFTPADPSGSPDQSPVDLSQYVPGPSSIENITTGAVMDVHGSATANNSAVVSYHRNGALNQGWNLHWVDGQTLSLQSTSSSRCLDIHNSTSAGPGRDLVIFDCVDGQQSQEWRVTQLDNETEQLSNVAYPSLCVDVSGGDNTNLVVENCSSAASQQWLFTSFDLTGTPSPDTDWDRDPSELIALPPNPGQPAERVAYFPSWSIYANAFYPKNLDTQGIAGRLTRLNYAFENIDPVNLTCFAANKAATTDPNDPVGNDGSSDAWADYQSGFTSANSVDGSTDTWTQPLKGNFNQLKQLKARYPNLKIQVSLGGWTYSKYFSDVAATDASRHKFVSSCIDMYIKGNLPVLGDNPAGGQGVAAGIFSGFDIDWEFPASANGFTGNHYGPQDTANFTLLLAEFRNQLNALGSGYTLTAALPAGPSDIDRIDVAGAAQYLDLGDVMSYDMHGAWETTGPADFQSPIYDSPSSPAAGTGFTANDAINRYLMRGFPSNKLVMGVPLYGRGWTGVPAGGDHGLYQTATGPSPAYGFSQQPGVAMYKELEADGKLNTIYYDPFSQSTWVYDGTNFWSIETPASLAFKRQYIKDKGLGGIMMYSLEADDSSSTLFHAATGL